MLLLCIKGTFLTEKSSTIASLKYRQLVLDENTSVQRYQTKKHERSSTIQLTRMWGESVTAHDGLTHVFEEIKYTDERQRCKNLFRPEKSIRMRKCHKPYQFEIRLKQ